MNKNELEKKQFTFSKLLDKDEQTNKLIISALLIGLIYDQCIKDKKILVSENFIQKCCSHLKIKIPDKMDMITIFHTLRNKLAHGDFYLENDKVIFSFKSEIFEISIDNIINFSLELTNYYKYLNTDIPSSYLVISNGIVIKITDICYSNKKNIFYDKYTKLNRRVKVIRNYPYLDFIKATNPGKTKQEEDKDKSVDVIKIGKELFLLNSIIGSKYFINNKYANCKITYEIIGYSNEEDKIIENSDGNYLLEIFSNYLTTGNNNELIDAFINFYIHYIYCLDRILRDDNLRINDFSATNVFDFSTLNINSSNIKQNNLIKKIRVYSNENEELATKLSTLHEELKDPNITNIQIRNIERKFKEIQEIYQNQVVQRMLSYAYLRSKIEHMRCSIIHGNCFLKRNSDKLYLKDEHEGKINYQEEIPITDFIEFCSDYNNNKKIENHVAKK